MRRYTSETHSDDPVSVESEVARRLGMAKLYERPRDQPGAWGSSLTDEDRAAYAAFHRKYAAQLASGEAGEWVEAEEALAIEKRAADLERVLRDALGVVEAAMYEARRYGRNEAAEHLAEILGAARELDVRVEDAE